MKIISTTDCKDSYVTFRSLDLSKICYKGIPRKSASGSFLPKVFKIPRGTRFSRSLDPEWYKISLELRSQTRLAFVYDVLPYVLQSLKISPCKLSKYIDPILLIKSIQDEILGTGITLITPNALVKFTVSFIRIILRQKVKYYEPTKTIEERDVIVKRHLERISPLLLPSCVLPTISFKGECFIPTPAEIIANIEGDYEG